MEVPYYPLVREAHGFLGQRVSFSLIDVWNILTACMLWGVSGQVGGLRVLPVWCRGRNMGVKVCFIVERVRLLGGLPAGGSCQVDVIILGLGAAICVDIWMEESLRPQAHG
eukprot:1154811-Pelagomonas_calceolata.AAC.1